MAAAPGVGDVTPGEYPAAYLRWLAQNTPGAGGSWAQGEPSLVDQAAAPVEETGASGGRIAGKIGMVKNFMGDLGALKSGEMPIGEFLAEHGAGLSAMGLPLAAQLAANPVGNFLGNETGNQDFGHFSSSVIKGAGIGAGIGSIVPIVGTGLGAAAGGALGALFGSKHHASQAEQLSGMESQAWSGLSGMGVDANTIKAVQGEYQTLKASQGINAATSYLNQVYQYQGQNSQQNLPGLPNSQTGLDPSHTLALQSAITGLMGPYMQQEAKTSNAQIDAFMRAATPEGQKISAATQHLGDLYKANNGEITNAYILQAQGEPFLNLLASSAYQKGLKAQAGASGSSLASLLTGSVGASGSASGTAFPNSNAPLATNYGGASPLLLQ